MNDVMVWVVTMPNWIGRLVYFELEDAIHSIERELNQMWPGETIEFKIQKLSVDREQFERGVIS